VLRGLFNGVTLVPTARSRLTPLANILRSTAGARARVEVFAGGPAAVAVPRARRQAEALRAALVALGVEASRLEADGVARVAGGARSDDRAEVVLLPP
jgi:outer membrane protein OmpA-like peptidoglycan-associated protein